MIKENDYEQLYYDSLYEIKKLKKENNELNEKLELVDKSKLELVILLYDMFKNN